MNYLLLVNMVTNNFVFSTSAKVNMYETADK